MEDIIVTHTLKEYQQATEELFETLQQLFCYISVKKTQLCSNKVIYLWYLWQCLESNSSTLCQRRIQAILNIPNKRQLKIIFENGWIIQIVEM